MKKRITSLLLTLVMLLSLVPALGVTASAAEDWTVVNSYAELKAALETYYDAKIKLGQDIDTKDDFPYGLRNGDEITVHGRKTLDLNGKKLTLRSEGGMAHAYIRVQFGHRLTLRDTVGGGEIYLDQKSGSIALIGVEGGFIMESGKLNAVIRVPPGFNKRGLKLINCENDLGVVNIEGGDLSCGYADGTFSDVGEDYPYYYGHILTRSSSCLALDTSRGDQTTISGGTFTGYVYLRSDDDEKVTISGGKFNNLVGFDVLNDIDDKEWAEPVIRVTGGEFYDVCSYLKSNATPTTAIAISGGTFEKFNIKDNAGDTANNDTQESHLEKEKPYLPLQITSGTFGTMNLRFYVTAFKDSETTAQFITSTAFRHLLNGSFIKMEGNIYTADSVYPFFPITLEYTIIPGSMDPIPTGNYYRHFIFEAPVTIIPGGQVKATLDDEPIGYYKDWTGPVEYLDNSTAHTLKFTWAPLPQEAKDAGYSYQIRLDKYTPGSSVQRETVASDRTDYTVTLAKDAAAGFYSYDLLLNLQKDGQVVGAMSNEHIVRIFLLNGTSTSYVKFSDVVTVDEAPPTASAVGSGYTVDSIGWFTDSGCSTQATAFTEGTAYYAKVVLKSSGNHVFVDDKDLGYPVVIPLCDGDNDNYSIVGRPTISDSGKTLTFVAKSTAITPFVWERVDTADMTHTIGTTGVNLHAKAVGGDVSQYRYITYKLYTQKDGETTVVKSATTQDEFAPVFWPAEAGVYRCWFEATRGFDTITSTPFTLTVSAPGLPINNQSGDFTIMQGGYARLFVIVGSVVGGVDYQWQVNSGGSWTDLPGETYYDYRAEPEEIGDHIYRCKLTNSYGEVGYSNEMTVTVLENETLGRTPVYILPAVNKAAPDPAALWPDKVIDVYDLNDQTFFKKAEYNVTAGGYFQAEAFYSVIPGDEGYILEMPSGTQKNLYYADVYSDEVDTAVMGTITYKWEATTEVDQWGFPTKYTELGTDPIINFPIPEGVETYWGRLTITNTIGTGDNAESRSSYVEITFHVDQPGTGTAVSGTVASYGSADDPVTVSLTKQGETDPAFPQTLASASGPAPYSQSYSFAAVPAGEYILKMEKNKHVAEEVTITVDTVPVTQDVTLYLLGDVNKNGSINIMDVRYLLNIVQQGGSGLDKTERGDINASGTINIMDVRALFNLI